MINTKNLVREIKDIPSYWAFQYYLSINEKLTGQDLKIRSIWNLSEKTPSMCIYVDRSKHCYMFKDFSTGKYGNKINLLQELFNLNYSDAVEKMIKDYNHCIKTNGKEEINFKPEVKWHMELVKTRQWTQEDAKYWLKYRIGTTLLSKYKVIPLDYYNMVKHNDENLIKMKIQASYMYGYYNKSKELYKIYQPYNKKHKFHKVFSHTQGLDQLKYNKPYLIITSSLKDIMSLDGFGYNIEIIAPDSENTMIKPYIIENLKNKYDKIITLFDNDKAGNNAINKYKKIYGINGTTLKLSKDISDSVKDYGFDKVHKELKPLLKEAINKKI